MEKLHFTSGQSELLDSEFFVSVPDGFHACTDPSIISVARKIVVVPEDYSFYDDPTEAEIALSIQSHTFDVPMPISPKNQELYTTILQQQTDIFDVTLPMFPIRIREGAGILYQLTGGSDWIKAYGVLFVDTTCYLLHLYWNHKRPEGNTDAVVEAFWKLANPWLERIYLPGEEQAPQFQTATPEEELYPHYEHIRSASKSLPGVVMVVNQSGTEFQFIPLKHTDSDLCQKIASVLPEPFPLADTAWEMAGLFRVDKSVFDDKHDRECQLKQRYMHRAYMTSALRSFFWTVKAYCEENDTTPDQLSKYVVWDLISHIAERQWLNYADDDLGSYLCSTQDLHVYYVSKNADMADQRGLMLNDMAQHAGSDLAYLEDLREDLAYIYPAVQTIYDELAANRNPYEQLTGDPADVLYAWCAWTIAAKETFFTEDGPTTCRFKQCTDTVTHKPATKPTTKKSASEPKKKATPISSAADFTIEHNILTKYSGAGGAVVVPEGVTKISSSAFSYREITSISLPKSLNEIGDWAFNGCKELKEIHLPEGLTTLGEYVFYNCSKLTTVTWPGSAKYIPPYAFSDCKSLEKINLSEGITEIGTGAFFSCAALTDVRLPASLCKVGNHAFLLADNVTLHVHPGSYGEKYADREKIRKEYIIPTPEELAQQEAEKKRREEEERLRLEAEAEQKRKEAEEAERKRREAEERKRKAAEAAERKRREAEEKRREDERKRKEALARRQKEYDQLTADIAARNEIIAQNRGWFGSQAKARKAAQEQLAILQARLTRDFPTGRP